MHTAIADPMKSKNLEKLKRQRQQLDESIKALAAAHRQQQRKDETRKKIVLGGMVMSWMAGEKVFADKVVQRLDEHLTRRIDRELFGLQNVAAAPSGS